MRNAGGSPTTVDPSAAPVQRTTVLCLTLNGTAFTYRTTGSPGSKSPASGAPPQPASSSTGNPELKTPPTAHNKALQNVKGDHPSVSTLPPYLSTTRTLQNACFKRFSLFVFGYLWIKPYCRFSRSLRRSYFTLNQAMFSTSSH